MKGIAAAVTLAVSLAGNACQPPPPPPATPVSHIYGASMTAQVTSTPAEDGDGRRWHAANGAGLGYWADPILAAYRAGPANVFLGDVIYNDAIRGGWSADDEAVWSWVIAARGSDDCVLVELPGVQPAAEIHWPGLTAELDQARAFLARMPVAGRFDWRAVITADPTVNAEDGMHLNTWGTEITPPVQARYGFVNQAMRTCRR